MDGTFWVNETQLDEEQRSAVQGSELDDSFLLRGPAGSGKTNILLLRAKWLTLKTRSHLRIVVFTASLRTFVQGGCSQYGLPSEIVVTGIQFLKELLADYGVPFESTGSFDSDRSLLAGKAKALLDSKGIQNTFDALLVDEAQDYSDTELTIFRRLTARLVLAEDTRQSIYRTTHTENLLETLVAGAVVNLKYHYRSGLRICSVADAVLRDSKNFPPIHAESKYDEKSRPSSVTIIKCETFFDQLAVIIGRLPQQTALYPGERIGVLFPKREHVSQFEDALTASGIDNSDVWVDTLHGAKGWEFRAVHIGACETLYKMGGTQKRLAYTGILRGKTSVALYYSGAIPGYLESAVALLSPPKADPGWGELFSKS